MTAGSEPRFRKVFLFDENGNQYTTLNPLPVDATVDIENINVVDYFTSREEKSVTAGIASTNFTFTQTIYGLFVQNQHASAYIYVKTSGGTATTAYDKIEPQGWRYYPEKILVGTGVSIISDTASTTVFMKGYFNT